MKRGILLKINESRKNGFRQILVCYSLLCICLLVAPLQFTNAMNMNNLCIDSDVGFIEDGGLAIEAFLNKPYGIAIAPDGSILIADTHHHRVRKIKNGQITSIAGTGVPGYEESELTAISAKLKYPNDIAIDSQGNIYISDSGNNLIRKINQSGIISTYAGTGNNGFSGDGDFAVYAELNQPRGIAFDTDDNLYIADTNNNRIRVVYSETKRIHTLVGNDSNVYNGEGIRARDANLKMPCDVFIDSYNNIWICDSGHHRVRKVDSFSNKICSVAGNGTPGSYGDGKQAIEANLFSPKRIVVHDSIFFISDADENGEVSNIRRVDKSGIITTYVGGGELFDDGHHRTDTKLSYPIGIDLYQDQLYLIERDSGLCRKVVNDKMYTVAGVKKNVETPKYLTPLNEPGDVFFDDEGNYYIADTLNNSVLKVTPSGRATRIAGNGEECIYENGDDCGNGREPSTARLSKPKSVLHMSFDYGAEYLFISEPNNHWIRRIDFAKNEINIFAGNGFAGVPDETVPPEATSLNSPAGLHHDSYGNIYFADSSLHCIYKINTGDNEPTIITPIAGTGDPGKTTVNTDGKYPNAQNAQLNTPADVWLDSSNRIFIADSGNGRVCMIDSEGLLYPIFDDLDSPQGLTGFQDLFGKEYLIVTDYNKHLIYCLDLNSIDKQSLPYNSNKYIISGTPGSSVEIAGDGGPALQGELNHPLGITTNAIGEIFIADSFNNRIRIISDTVCEDPTNVIKTIAGLFKIDGLSALQTSIREASGVDVDPDGNIYYSDSKNHRVIKKTPSGDIKAIAGNGTAGYSGDGKDAVNAQLRSPKGIKYYEGIIFIADMGNHAIRMVDENGIITTIMGNGFLGNSLNDAFDKCLNTPTDVDVDQYGDVIIADSNNHRIISLDIEKKTFLIVAGNNGPGNMGDGSHAKEAQLLTPTAISFMNNDLLIVDSGNHKIRIVKNINSYIDTFAGSGVPDPPDTGTTTAPNVNLKFPTDVTVDSNNNVYIVDSGHNQICKVQNNQSKTVSIIISDLASPRSVALLNDSDLIISVCDFTIKSLDLTTVSLSRIAGNNLSGFSGDAGAAISASLNSPYGLATDIWGNIFIADKNNHRIRKISAFDHTITTLAGTENNGFSGDGQEATRASLNYPHSVAVNLEGDIFIADTNNHRIRVIRHNSSIIETFAGCRNIDGTIGDSCSEGNPNDSIYAQFFALNYPQGVTVDSYGNIYVADTGNKMVHKIDGTKGTLVTIASGLGSPCDVAVDPQRNVYVSDTKKHQIILISQNLKNEYDIYVGGSDRSKVYVYKDYKSSGEANLYSPTYIDVDGASNLYIVNSGQHVVQQVVEKNRAVMTVAGNGKAGFSGELNNPIHASLLDPKGIAVGIDGSISIADTGNHLIRKIVYKGYPEKWNLETTQYQYAEKFILSPRLEGNNTGQYGDKIALFFGDECRGVANAVKTPYGIRFFLKAWSNNLSDQDMLIKYYDHSKDKIIEVEQELYRLSGNGTLEEPVYVDLVPDFDCEKRLAECEANCKEQALTIAYLKGVNYAQSLTIAYLEGVVDTQYLTIARLEGLVDAQSLTIAYLESVVDAQDLTIIYLTDIKNQLSSYSYDFDTGWYILSSMNAETVHIKADKQCIGAIWEYTEGAYHPVIESVPVMEAEIPAKQGFWLNITESCNISVKANP
jgi:sugar lactone lactonase YvrE